MARAIEAYLRLPIFSIKHPEAFQVRASLPIPQPSTLMGLLTYCIGVAEGIGMRAGGKVKRWVDEGKLLAARASLLKEAPPMTISTIVLRRFRVVDKAYLYEPSKGAPKYVEIIGEAILRKDFGYVKSLLEKDLTDAFYREYVVAHEIKVIWVVSDEIEFKPEWLMLTQRMGDTESLCTVVKVDEAEAEVVEKDVVETGYPAYLEDAKDIDGAYTIMKMCDEAFFYYREGVLRRFIVPCEIRIEKIKGRVVPMMIPSKVKIQYERPVKVIRTERGEEIVAYTQASIKRGRQK